MGTGGRVRVRRGRGGEGRVRRGRGVRKEVGKTQWELSERIAWKRDCCRDGSCLV